MVSEVDALISVARFRELEFSVGEPKTILHDPKAWGSPLFKCSDGSIIFKSLRSNDGGETWQEGQVGREPCTSMVQLSDGLILGLDFHTKAGKESGQFIGKVWKSKDNWRTVEGPIDVQLYVPDAVGGYADDDKTYISGPLFHRSILELENGDLLASMYGWFKGNSVLAKRWKYNYKKMCKYRSFVVLSKDRGKSWSYLSTIAYDPEIGGEGFNETVLSPTSDGGILAMIRVGSGEPMYQSKSKNQGRTWSKPVSVGVAGVDPDMVLLSNGVLACSYGRPGNNVMFSVDGTGRQWSHHIVLRSSWFGATGGYTSIREAKPNEILVTFSARNWIETTQKEPITCHRYIKIKVQIKEKTPIEEG